MDDLGRIPEDAVIRLGVCGRHWVLLLDSAESHFGRSIAPPWPGRVLGGTSMGFCSPLPGAGRKPGLTGGPPSLGDRVAIASPFRTAFAKIRRDRHRPAGRTTCGVGGRFARVSCS